MDLKKGFLFGDEKSPVIIPDEKPKLTAEEILARTSILKEKMEALAQEVQDFYDVYPNSDVESIRLRLKQNTTQLAKIEYSYV